MTNLSEMTTAERNDLYTRCARALTNDVITGIINELQIEIPQTTDTELLNTRTELLAAFQAELTTRA